MALRGPLRSKTQDKLTQDYHQSHNLVVNGKLIQRVTFLTLAAALTCLSFWSFTFFDLSDQVVKSNTKSADPTSEWLDEDWPYHEQEPWDISTDFAYPRTLEYEVFGP